MRETLDKVIINPFDLYKGCILRNGFVFTSIDNSPNIFDALVIRNPIKAKGLSERFDFSKHSLKEHISLINKYSLEKAIICSDDISFILQCPTLKVIQVIPSEDSKNHFDFSPLYHLPDIKSLYCKTTYNNDKFSGIIDYSNFNNLQIISISENVGHLNFNKISSLKKLFISNNKKNNLCDYFNSPNLEEITLLNCSIKNLDGINKSLFIKSVSLQYNRNLTDISYLSSIKNHLEVLSLYNCSRIKDFTCLYGLENLKHLELLGNNTIPSLSFLNNMKNLKTFSFSMNVIDGDLTPCFNIPYVNSIKNRKHYNYRDKDLPKKLG